MKLLPLLAAGLATLSVCVSASSEEYQPEMLGERSLPAESRHPLSMERRKAMFDEYYQDLAVEKRGYKTKNQNGPKRKCKNKPNKKKNHKKNKKNNSKPKSSTDLSQIATTLGNGLIGLSFKRCGSSGATKEHPNGSQSFLNCGVEGAGWTPPNVKLNQLKAVDADQALKGAFKECKDVAWAFKKAGKQYDLPPVLLMSFAMQESTCNPKVTGGNGEQGLMQITPDKCGGAPNGNCKDVWFNVNKGAKYFKDTLDECNGNVLEALGRYNGWAPGMTVAKATAAKKHGNCFAQNNLDYLYQMLNGWMLGKTGYNLGKYQNLKGC